MLYKPNYCTSKQVGDLTVVHYGATKFHPEIVDPIKNYSWAKPRGGLWTSPIGSDWGWKEWCDANDFRDCKEENSFKLRFHHTARIVIVDTLKDLEEIPSYPLIPGSESMLTTPDFELVAGVADAIWLTRDGEIATRFSHPHTLYGWDCESVLVMNPQCCHQIK
jgi:hypothetical protein